MQQRTRPDMLPPLLLQYDGALYDIHSRSDICPWSCVATPYVRVLYVHYEGLCTQSCSPRGIHDRGLHNREGSSVLQ
jgi:hypothetical protein